MIDIDDKDLADDIIKTDTINELYSIFDDIDEIQYNKNLSYKVINDTENYFIMINQEFLKILGKISLPGGRTKRA
jgi:hypothetical protein